MSQRWAVRLPLAEASTVGSLRLWPAVDVCEDGASLWLRGRDLPAVEGRLRALPGAERFAILDDDQLVPAGRRLPKGRLPTGPWRPLDEYVQCRPGSDTWPATLRRQVELRLAPSDDWTEPTLLLCELRDWLAYAATAPQARLDRLGFAVADNSRTLIRGTPLPPLPGVRLVEHGGIAVPAGQHWSPHVSPQTLREALGAEIAGEPPGDLVLILDADCSWQRVPADAFVRASRSAARLTAEALR